MTEHEIAALDAELTELCVSVARLDAMVRQLEAAISPAAAPAQSPQGETQWPQAA